MVYTKETDVPKDKDLKRLVRARMQKTGEAYTAARAHVLKKPKAKRTKSVTPATSETPATSRDSDSYAAIAGMSDDAVKAKTGCTWDKWVRSLDYHGAATMSHPEIVRLLSERYHVTSWWRQMIAVGYERIRGLRARGQGRDGTYEATKSRTFDVPVAKLFEAWADARIRRRWLPDEGVRVRTATAPKSIRLGWSDGTIIAAGFTAKGDARSAVALSHGKWPDRESVTRVKTMWAERLAALERVLDAE